MRVEYSKKDNELVSRSFISFFIKKYFLALGITLLIGFFLIMFTVNVIARCIYEGAINIKMYEILFIPLSVIPIVSFTQTIFFFISCMDNIDSGKYVVDRRKIKSIRKSKVYLGDNLLYHKSSFISRKIIQLTNEVDVVSIINNYGRIIWTIIIPANQEPQKFEEVSVSES